MPLVYPLSTKGKRESRNPAECPAFSVFTLITELIEGTGHVVNVFRRRLNSQYVQRGTRPRLYGQLVRFGSYHCIRRDAIHVASHEY